MEMETGSAQSFVLYAAMSLSCALLLLVVGEAGLCVASLALRGEMKAWWPHAHHDARLPRRAPQHRQRVRVPRRRRAAAAAGRVLRPPHHRRVPPRARAGPGGTSGGDGPRLRLLPLRGPRRRGGARAANPRCRFMRGHRPRPAQGGCRHDGSDQETDSLAEKIWRQTEIFSLSLYR